MSGEAQQAAPAELIREAKARVGQSLNAEWRIEALLGMGGMATVFAAAKTDGTRAAVKVLHAEFARDSNIRERFLREGRIANLVDHPSRVPVFEEGLSDHGEAFLAMELLDGANLSTYLKRRGGKIPVEDTFAIFAPVLELLQKCHEAKIIHRDIKPANIVITRAGAVKVLDFGIARLREQQGAQGAVEATRQGTALGTPSFMAPEQALGLVDRIDGRADLFSVGACIYTCLTGLRLHQAPTQNEALILAATKSAPSVARALPELPVELVAFVDKGLAFDRNARFQDADAMRTEMLRLLEAHKAGQLTVGGGKKTGITVRATEVVEDDAPPAEGKAKFAERLKSIWRSLSLAMADARQFGWEHPEAAKALQAAFAEITDALTAAPAWVRWDITPYAFNFEDTPIWEPDKRPYDRVPYRLFGDGLRRMQLKRGLTADELRELLGILQGGAADAAAGEDDAVTKVWDRGFEHVAYLAIDSFVEGDAADREAFQQVCDEVADRAARLVRIDTDSEESSLEARAMQLNLAGMMREAADAAAAIALSVPARASLQAQIQVTPEGWQERFVDSLAAALAEGVQRGDLELLAETLREWVADHVAQRHPAAAFAVLDGLKRALAHVVDPQLARSLEQQLGRMMFPAATLKAILKQVAGEGVRPGQAPLAVDTALCVGLEKALEVSDEDLFAPVAEALGRGKTAEARLVLLGHLRRHAKGHEADLAGLTASLPQEMAVEIVKLLAEAGSPEAQAALVAAFASPHAVVRAEALRRLTAVPEGAADELGRLLGDTALEVKQEALRVIGKLKVTSLMPAIMRRIQAPSFHGLPVDERRSLLAALWQINPARGEAIAAEILAGSKIVAKAEVEKSRIVAAEMLKGGRSKEGLAAAQAAARRMWWNSPEVREAAEKAVAAIAKRQQGGAP